jgi:hypothetical protein
VGSNSASSRASARLRATVVFVRRPRASKSERSRLVVDRPASAAATSRSSSASRSESVTSVPSTSSFTKGGAACLSTQRRSADLFKRQVLRTRRPTGLDRATLTRRPPARQARTRGAAAGAGARGQTDATNVAHLRPGQLNRGFESHRSRSRPSRPRACMGRRAPIVRTSPAR